MVTARELDQAEDIAAASIRFARKAKGTKISQIASSVADKALESYEQTVLRKLVEVLRPANA